MSEFLEKIERKKRLKIKSDKKNKYNAVSKDRREESREENLRIKYKKQYLEHMQKQNDNNNDE